MVRVQVKHGGGGGGGVSDDQTEFLYECPITCNIDEIARDLTEISNLQSMLRRFVLQLEPRLSLHHQDKKGFGLSLYLFHFISLSLFLLHLSPAMTLRRVLSEAKSYVSQPPLSLSIFFFIALLFRGLELLQEDKVELLWAGKKLLKGKQLCDYIGKIEKTKIVLRLQSPDSHPVFNSEAEPCGK